MVCITNKTVMLSRVIRGGYGELRQGRIVPASLILVLGKTSYGEGRGRRITRGILVLEEEGFNGNSRREGNARAEMVDLWLVHWEFFFADVVQR